MKKVIADGKELDDMVKIEIEDESGKVVRTFYRDPAEGTNRTHWDLKMDAPRNPRTAKPDKETEPRSGFYAPPGNYQVTITYNENSSSNPLVVHADPRIEVDKAQWMEKMEMMRLHNGLITQTTEAMDEIRSMQKKLNLIKDLIKENTISNEKVSNQLSIAIKNTFINFPNP